MNPDYYAVLGVDSTAAAGEIKRAYRKLARKYHPDKNLELDTDAERRLYENRFKDVGEAYRVLKDPINRAHFDQTGSGKLPKSKDMAVKKIIHLFRNHIKEALEEEMEKDLVDSAMVRFGVTSAAASGMDVLIENVRLDLTNEKDKTEAAIDALEKGVAKLNKYKRKVTTKGDTNLYLQVIEQQLEATQGALAAGGIEKIALETALLFLKDYEYGDIAEDPEYLAIPSFLRNQDNLAEETCAVCDGTGWWNPNGTTFDPIQNAAELERCPEGCPES